MFSRHHALPKQVWTKLFEIMHQINCSTVFLACVWSKQQKSPKEKGSLDGGLLSSRREGRGWGGGEVGLGIHTPPMPISLHVFLPWEQGAGLLPCAEKGEQGECLPRVPRGSKGVGLSLHGGIKHGELPLSKSLLFSKSK